MDAVIRELSYQYKDVPSLKKAYMGFVHDMGIFVPTEEVFQLGDAVTATLTLPNELTFTCHAVVIWITPKHASGDRHAGVGLQCSEDEGDAFQKAVRELTGTVEDVNETDTM